VADQKPQFLSYAKPERRSLADDLGDWVLIVFLLVWIALIVHMAVGG
jgi:hypothetical protein